MTRRLKDGIIDGFLSYTEETEIPDVFSFWTAISTISAAMGRDCFISMGHFDIYPNMYIVLVAGSAICRKSSAISIAHRLISKIEPTIHILSQKMTPEAMIGALSGLEAKDERMIVQEASGIVVVDELSTLIDKNAFQSGMIPLLTKLYDCEDFDYLTKARGREVVRNPCLSIMGGSTLCWIKGAIPQVAIGGGFTSRVVFIYREKNEKLNPFPTLSEKNKKRWDDIIHDLSRVAQDMRGGFALSSEAKDKLSDEYTNFMRSSKLLTNPHMSGYAGRRHTTMLKLCMAISASDDDSRLIDLEDAKLAISAMMSAEVHMPKVLQAISSEVVGDLAEQVLNIVVQRQTVPRHELVKIMKWKLTVGQLDMILDTLIAERVVGKSIDGTDISYYFTKVKK